MLIQIQETGHKGLKTGDYYRLKQSGDDMFLINDRTKKGRKVTYDFIRKLKCKYVNEYEYAM